MRRHWPPPAENLDEPASGMDFAAPVNSWLTHRRLGVIRFSSKVGQRESNPYLPPSRISCKVLKPQSQERPCSQESQPVCRKHLHGVAEQFSVSLKEVFDIAGTAIGDGSVPGRTEDRFYDALLELRERARKIWSSVVEYEGL
jgi:hypothetical protein